MPVPLHEASLYIHVPFCLLGKCDYCDFYSVPVQPGDPRLERFVETLLSDGKLLFEKWRPRAVPTLYIGGGTPSALGPAGTRTLLKGLLELVAQVSDPPGEITIEANPESADEAFLTAALEAGATRLSLGVQTFHGPSRRAVHRGGAYHDSDADAELLRRRLALAASYFPSSFSADLISGLPFQDESILLNDIATLLSYKPAHVSFYALTVEPHTPLAAAGNFLPRGDEADRLWLTGRDTLEKAGYRQYEVSNFSPEGNESLHNIRYWRMQNWLALGPSASGTIIDDETATGFRYTIPPDVDTRLEKLSHRTFGSRRGEIADKDLSQRRKDAKGENKSISQRRGAHGDHGEIAKKELTQRRQTKGLRGAKEMRGVPNCTSNFAPLRLCVRSSSRMVPGTFSEELDSLTLIKESFLMGFRYIEGPDEDLFRRRFRRGIPELIPKTVDTWQGRGLLRKDKMALTNEGLLFLDPFLINAFQELDGLFSPC